MLDNYATNTHSEYVTLLAFPRQYWLRERNSVLRYTYIARFVRTQAECLLHGTNLTFK
jgi:hypothetical protein